MVLIDNLLYNLFAEKFKAKIKANIFLFKTLNINFLHGLSFVKIVPIFNI